MIARISHSKNVASLLHLIFFSLVVLAIFNFFVFLFVQLSPDDTAEFTKSSYSLKNASQNQLLSDNMEAISPLNRSYEHDLHYVKGIDSSVQSITYIQNKETGQLFLSFTIEKTPYYIDAP